MVVYSKVLTMSVIPYVSQVPNSGHLQLKLIANKLNFLDVLNFNVIANLPTLVVDYLIFSPRYMLIFVGSFGEYKRKLFYYTILITITCLFLSAQLFYQF